MDRKRVFVRLLLIGAGGGCLALAIFAGQPWLTALVAPTQPMGAEEIVGDVLDAPAGPGGQVVGVDDSAVLPPPLLPEGGEASRGPEPLIAVRHNGEEVPVLFPAAEGAEAGEKDEPSDGLPPVLTLEEVAAAMSAPESADAPRVKVAEAPGPAEDGDPQPVVMPAAATEHGGDVLPDVEPSPWPASAEAPEPLRPPVAIAGQSGSSHAFEMTLPPSPATREVQALLRKLGYTPGPLDGIWGERTDDAWRRFARETARREARTWSARSQAGSGEAVSAARPPDATAPPEGDLAAESRGEGQAGEVRVGLPPQTPVQHSEPVRVPGTLRGVMGYRLPLVSRQEVPDQVVSGVLIPAHTTFVILRGGEWELVDLKPTELERLRVEPPAAPPEAQPSRRGWDPLRLFRRKGPAAQTETGEADER